MIGNVRESFQRNVSVHHSWNRGTAIHGTNYLRMQHCVLYSNMGHTVFIEDGVEEFNRVEGNLGIKTMPSMNLLNTDQTPAVFWIVTGKNYILNNHAVASRRYGLWFRPEISATGTSVNTPDVHPINIPVLEFDGNVGHSNGKYGLRVFDIYLPNEPSVFRNTFVWRNGKVGWTATVIGRVAFDNMVSVDNGFHVFESRSTNLDNWNDCYISNSLFVDKPDVALPLGESFAAFEDSFGAFEEMGGPMEGGLLLPWNEDAGGGMVVENVTFVNFQGACIRGCAHCGRGGSPVLGDGAFETRFAGMKFVNSPERALFRHPNEASLYDMDGTLTDTGVKEDYTKGGNVRGSTMVGWSTLLPAGNCTQTSFSTTGTGGAICQDTIFRRMWYIIEEPAGWIGKALCVRRPDQSSMNTCQTLQPECNCLPYLKKAWKGNVWLAAEGARYNVQMDLLPQEEADPEKWEIKVWDVSPMEDFYFTQRFLQWDTADRFNRPLYWTNVGGGERLPVNWIYNESDPNNLLTVDTTYAYTSYDALGTYLNGTGMPGRVPIPAPDSTSRNWAVKEDADGNGAMHTMHVRGPLAQESPVHRGYAVSVYPCPWNAGGRVQCPDPPAPPPRPPAENFFSLWSSPQTWRNLTDHAANPLVALLVTETGKDKVDITKTETVQWQAAVPSAYEDVWVPWWKKVSWRLLCGLMVVSVGRFQAHALNVAGCAGRFPAAARQARHRGDADHRQQLASESFCHLDRDQRGQTHHRRNGRGRK